MCRNVTVLSYLDTVGFEFVTYAELVPDLWDIAEEIDEPLKELEKAGSGSSRVVARR